MDPSAQRAPATLPREPHGTARSVADGVSSALSQVTTVADQTGEGIFAFRDAVRRAPLAMSLVMLGVGYLIGAILEAGARRR